MNKKLGFRPRDPHGENRAGILRRIPVVPNGGMAIHLVAKRCDLESLGVPGPASTPWAGGGRAGGGRAVAPTLTPLVSAHPPKIAIPLLGGTWP